MASTRREISAIAQRKSAKIHGEQFAPLFCGWTLEFFHNCGPPLYGGVEDRQAIGAEENNDPAAEPPDIVYALNQGVDRHLVFMVAVILRARRRQ